MYNMNSAKKIIRTWIAGVRFYIAISIALITLEVLWLSETLYSGGSLATIRLEETYGWLSIGFLSVALLIGPTLTVFKRLPGRRQLLEARRLIGIGAAWFALLHSLITYIAQFKSVNPLDLPFAYQRAFLVGLFALIILLALAATSFNRAFRAMGIWWFRLHRLVYIAAVLVVVHVALIGVHAKTAPVLAAFGSVGFLVIGGHLYRNQSRKLTKSIQKEVL